MLIQMMGCTMNSHVSGSKNYSIAILRYNLTGDCFLITDKAAYFAKVRIFIGLSVLLLVVKENPHVAMMAPENDRNEMSSLLMVCCEFSVNNIFVQFCVFVAILLHYKFTIHL